MLKTLGPQGEAELRCRSHLGCLLSKLNAMFRSPNTVYTLVDLSELLQYEAWFHDYDSYSHGMGVEDMSGNLKRKYTNNTAQ